MSGCSCAWLCTGAFSIQSKSEQERAAYPNCISVDLLLFLIERGGNKYGGNRLVKCEA